MQGDKLSHWLAKSIHLCVQSDESGEAKRCRYNPHNRYVVEDMDDAERLVIAVAKVYEEMGEGK